MNAPLTAELLFQQIIEHSFDEIFITDGLGNILYVSSSCQDLYGVPGEDMINQNVFTLEQEGILSPSVTALVLKNKSMQTLVQNTKTARKVLVSAYPITDEAREVIGTLSFSRDITELEYLKKRNDQVAQTIRLYQQEIEALKRSSLHSFSIRSGKMNKVLELASKVADLDVTVLLEGESGVGKNRIAQLIHQMSERRDQPFVEVNCGAIPETLFESELFGYEEGAFTGAKKGGKSGYFEAAEGGTLFLDEIAELPLNLQVKLLTVLQNQTITRIGSNKKKTLTCRIICATNQNLAQLVKERKFRDDLYYRINVINITIPSLRERTEEIVPLIYEITDEMNAKYKMNKQFSAGMIGWISQQEWPGNVRELRNFIEKTMITSNENVIETGADLFKDTNASDSQEELTYARYMEAIEREFIQRMYAKYPNSIKLAEKLGLSQSTANRKINKYCKGESEDRSSQN